jgi:hypothetical protein
VEPSSSLRALMASGRDAPVSSHPATAHLPAPFDPPPRYDSIRVSLFIDLLLIPLFLC